jgi:hypothetical protein
LGGAQLIAVLAVVVVATALFVRPDTVRTAAPPDGDD